MTFLKKKHSAFRPSRVLAIGFLGMILLGAVLLWMPFSTRDGVALTPLDALFTATSAVCVTGLTVVDTAGTYSLTGQLIIILLIQLGGLGFMLFATSVLVLARRRISLRNRVLLHETMSMPGLSGAVRTALRFMGIVFVVELAGALVLSSQFIPRYGVWTGIYYGFFHAVSAFCNAGFDLFGAAGSLRQFQQNPLVLSTISLLIIIGGLGFAVVADLADHGFRLRKTSLHTRIVLVTTILLLVSGTVFFAVMEWNNPRTLAFEGAGVFDKLNNAWFQSTTTRTAGFSSFEQNGMRDGSLIVSAILMFIGASPASTGGGIKTTTIFVLAVLIRSVFYGNSDVNAFRRRLPLAVIRTALSIFVINFVLLMLGAVFLSLSEEGRGFRMLDLIYEQVSALATVGLSSLGTGRLSQPSRMWLIVLMYFGRVGPLTMMLSFSSRFANQAQGIRYAEEQIIVG